MKHNTKSKPYGIDQCIGVFEGGGVRGAAFGGAYAAAREAGFNFVGTVGTSAGSVAAVLIAARAILGSAKLLGNKTASRLRQYYGLGLHSSKGLEKWVNNALLEAIPTATDPVLFKDLPRPSAVVATDLRRKTFKVWGKPWTPETPVGYAVRCSCSIPLFFEPVRSEGSIFVDGGVIANLPVFLARDPRFGLDPDIPVLAFRLIKDEETSGWKPQNGLDLMKLLVETVLNGMTEIQLGLAGERQVIDIPTADVSSTDFEVSSSQIDMLVDAGKNAVNDFLMDEHQLIAAAPQPGAHLQGYREGLLDQTAEIIKRARKEIYIAAGDLSWIGELYVSLVEAALRSVAISVICEPNGSDDFNKARVSLLALGARVYSSSEPQALRGTLIDPGLEATGSMVTIETQPRPHGRFYVHRYDRQFLKFAAEEFDRRLKAADVAGVSTSPTLQPIPENEIIYALQNGVPQYSNAQFSVGPISVDEARPLTKYLERFKLRRARDVDLLLSSLGIQSSARVDGSSWPITPPVLERLADGSVVIIDGTHRAYAARVRGDVEMRAVVVEAVSSPLPATPLQNWNYVTVSWRKRSRAERYSSYVDHHFRPIRSAFSSLATGC